MEQVECGDSQDVTSIAGRYLTFQLGASGYGIPIVRIQEIIGVSPVTGVPQSRPYLVGVMNLRGKVIPVTDLRRILGMEGRQPNDRTCYVVVQSVFRGETVSCGLIVDEVSEVIDFVPNELTRTASESFDGETHFVMAFGRRDNKVSMLLNVDGMLALIIESRRVGFKDAKD